MYASDTLDDNPMVAGDLPNAPFNKALQVARSWEGFMVSCIEDAMYARAMGMNVKDLHENPNARARKNKAGEEITVCTYVTDATLDEVREITERILAITKLAGRAAILPNGSELVDRMHKPMQAALSRMSILDPALWLVFKGKGKQWLTGDERALLDIDGFTWTKSGKGQSTYARYDETGDTYMGANKAMHAYVTPGAYVSERDVLAVL